MEFGFRELNARLEALDGRLKKHADSISYPEWFMMPTNEGIRFLLATLLLALASFNTGNNLIYLIFGLMLSIILLSYVLAALNTRGLRLKVKVPGPVYASEESEVIIRIRNEKRFASYSIRIRLPDELSSSAFLPFIQGGGASSVRARISPKARGVFGYGSFIIESSFPFIFFKRRCKVHVDGSLTVYPALMDIDLGVLWGNKGEGAHTQRPGEGDELLSLREFREGDSQKSVHWKASAKSHGLLVKEYASLMPKTVVLMIDGSGESSPDLFERSVSWAASAAIRLIESGYYTGLAAPGAYIPYGSGKGHLFRLLDQMAVLSEQDEAPEPETAHAGALLCVRKSRGGGGKAAAEAPDLVVYADTL